MFYKQKILKINHKLTLLLCGLLLLLSGCGGNVRWMHPDPSPELLLKAMTDLHGFHAYNSAGDEDNSLLSSEDAERLLADTTLITPDTPNFQFVSFSGKTVSIIGYNRVYRIPGTDYRSPMIYRYSAELKRARYALPHMAPVSGTLLVTSAPVGKLAVHILPLANEQVLYPPFNGEIKFKSYGGYYYAIGAFSGRHFVF